MKDVTGEITLRHFEIERQPELEQQTGNPVLGIEGLAVVAAAQTNSENAAVWDFIDTNKREFLCQAKGVAEARRVLIGFAKREELEPTGIEHCKPIGARA